MKKLFSLLLLFFVAACAATKEPPFDPEAVFKKAEENMQNKAFEEARKGYQAIEEKSPDKSYDAVLMLRVADTYFGEEKYSEARVEYQAFLNYHPASKDAAYAQYQVAMCSYKELTTIDRDPTPDHAVISEMRKLLQKYPKNEYREQAKQYIDTCLDRLAQYELYVAKFYYKKDSYKAAADRCENLLKNYPGSSAEKDALYYAGLSYMKLGEQGRARSAFEVLAQKYPAMEKTVLALLLKLRTP